MIISEEYFNKHVYNSIIYSYKLIKYIFSTSVVNNNLIHMIEWSIESRRILDKYLIELQSIHQKEFDSRYFPVMKKKI